MQERSPILEMETVVGELNGQSCDHVALQKEEMETPLPYCLHHNMEIEVTTLEAKHCWEKGCPHLVFVKEVWVSPKTEEATKTQNSIEVKIS